MNPSLPLHLQPATTSRQPTLRVPLWPFEFRLPERVASDDETLAIALGSIGLTCRTQLRLETAPGHRPTIPLDFVVDSGAAYAMLGMKAVRGRLPEPTGPDFYLPFGTADGGRHIWRVRPGRMRAWWDPQLRGYPFDWPVLYVLDPPTVPPILGLGGIVQSCRWTIEGSYSPDFPYGFLQLEDNRS